MIITSSTKQLTEHQAVRKIQQLQRRKDDLERIVKEMSDDGKVHSAKRLNFYVHDTTNQINELTVLLKG